jgi:hypothetical protein
VHGAASAVPVRGEPAVVGSRMRMRRRRRRRRRNACPLCVFSPRPSFVKSFKTVTRVPV